MALEMADETQITSMISQLLDESTGGPELGPRSYFLPA